MVDFTKSDEMLQSVFSSNQAKQQSQQSQQSQVSDLNLLNQMISTGQESSRPAIDFSAGILQSTAPTQQTATGREDVASMLDDANQKTLVTKQSNTLAMARSVSKIDESFNEIERTNARINMLESNPLLQLRGIFDSEYDPQALTNKINREKTKIAMEQDRINLTDAMSRKTIDLATAPLNSAIQKQQLSQDKFTKELAEQTAVLNLKTLKSTERKRVVQDTLEKSQFSFADLKSMSIKGDYTKALNAFPDMTATDIDNAVADRETVRSKFLAASATKEPSKRAEIVDSALKLSSTQTLQAMQQEASDPANNGYATTEEGLKIPLSLIQGQLHSQQQKDVTMRKEQVGIQTRFSPLMPQATQNAQGLDTISSIISGRTVTSLQNLVNFDNFTVESFQSPEFQQNIANVPAQMQAPAMEYYRELALFNGRKGDLPDPTRLETLQQASEALNKQIQAFQKTDIESRDKNLKAGVTQFYETGGRIISSDAAFPLVMESLTSMRLPADPALQKAVLIAQENLITEFGGTVTNIPVDMTSEERNAIMTEKITQQLFAIDIKKPDIRARAAKALRKKGETSGTTPTQSMLNHHTMNVVLSTLGKLSQKHPEVYKSFLTINGQPTALWKDEQQRPSFALLANQLAALSYKDKIADNTLEDNLYNNLLSAEIDLLLRPVEPGIPSYADTNLQTTQHATPETAAWAFELHRNDLPRLLDVSVAAVVGSSQTKAWDALVQDIETTSKLPVHADRYGGFVSPTASDTRKQKAIEKFLSQGR